VFHVSWFADDGVHVCDVWQSGEDFDRFVNDRLMPVVAGEMGITSQPKVTVTPAHSVFEPAAGLQRKTGSASNSSTNGLSSSSSGRGSSTRG
jgi:hypothetical protein